MVNFGLNSASILGIFLAVGGAGLYFMRSFRPELSRDHDIFFAAIGLLCGFILIFQGWRLDPILQFGQFLLAASVVFFAVETVRLRGATTEQARRTSGKSSNNNDDDYRPVTNAYTYTAELDELDPVEDYPDNRRLRGTRRSDDYETDPPRRRAAPPRPGSTGTTPEGRPKRSSSKPDKRSRTDDWETTAPRNREDWNDEPSPPSRSPSRPPSRRPSSEYSTGYSPDDYETPPSPREQNSEPRPRRPRPPASTDNRPREVSRDTPPRARTNRNVPPPEDYVDFEDVPKAPAKPEEEDQPRGSEY